MNNCFYNLFDLVFNRITTCLYVENNDDYKIINDTEIKKSVIIYYVCPDCGYKFSNIKCVCGYVHKPS